MKRIPELDALRGLAAVAIVAFHYGQGSALQPITDAGVLALDLFFVLSGFLISSIILSHGGDRAFLLTFYARRGLRIWPAYYAFIAGIAAIIFLRPGFGSLRALPYYLTFTQYIPEYWFAEAPQLALAAQPTWSLAVEEQFYILWPILLTLVGVRRMIPTAIAFVAVAIAARDAGYGQFLLISRCDGFAVGGLLAVSLAGRRAPGSERVTTPRLAALASVCAAYLLVVPALQGFRPLTIHRTPTAAVDGTVAAAAFAAVVGLVVRHAGRPALAPLRARWLVHLGAISYGVYLYHMLALVCGDAVTSELGWPRIASRAALSPVLTLIMAVVSWEFLEKPCLRLKDRFGYGRGRVATPIEPSPREGVVIEWPAHGSHNSEILSPRSLTKSHDINVLEK
jgi:peptidoglycan/LPS O-acetylase OafA/YrhL